MAEPSGRTYDNTLRAEQAAQTRARVLDAAVELLAEGGEGDLAMRDVAERAGVSLRTVYRNFAARDELLDGVVTWITDQFAARVGPEPVTRHDYTELTPSIFRLIFEMEPLYRALYASPAGREAHIRSNTGRRAMIEHAFAAELAGMKADARKRFAAVMHLVSSSNGAFFMHTYAGLAPDDTGRAARWAIAVLADAAADPRRRRDL